MISTWMGRFEIGIEVSQPLTGLRPGVEAAHI